ncbi:hypothetical protein [Halochromatium roseum]|uniref:hypothetical protein n=1 Tax=Halochromatium roseum TaxID=391920 RepID=UPI0019113A16|nr:hypothetical protein [Halochromatium roseum]MBK5937776.1 hypothetical protein [Halochromatium roseum]
MVRIVVTPPAAVEAESTGPIPLTHHQILELVAPFSRRGCQVDLAASDRALRRLNFKPVSHPNLPLAGEALTESLVLEHPEDDLFRLCRTLTDDSGLSSTLEIEGTDAGLLLEQVEAIAVERQIIAVEGVHIARSYRLQPVAASEQRPAYWRLQLTTAEARVEGTVLTLNAKTGRKMPADIELDAEAGQRLQVPADLFAVLGWDWRPLRPLGKFWRGSLRIAADEPARTRDAESKLSQAVSHLAKTLRSDPADFHARWQRARWRATFQRAIPLLIGIGLLGSAPLVQLFTLEQASVARMLIFHAPPMLLIGIFMMRELPVIEIPPMPRRLVGRDWMIDDGKGHLKGRSVQGVEAG